MHHFSYARQVALLLLVGILAVESKAGQHFHHRYHTHTKCVIPGPANYGHDDRRHVKSVFAQFKPNIDIHKEQWRFPDPKKPNYGTVAHQVKVHSFHFPEASLDVDGVRLEQVGIKLSETGRLDTTGVVIHAGGPDGTLQGNWVKIRLRAYTALPNESPRPLDGTVVWQSEECFWVSRGERRTMPLADPAFYPPGICIVPLQQAFEQITYIEVELEYRNDR